jgi:hypothetical protein
MHVVPGNWPTVLLAAKTQPAVGPREFLHKLQIPKFAPAPLIGVEKPVDLLLADWPLKGDARKHFERGVREIKTRKLDSLPLIHGSPARKVSPVLRRAAFAFAIRDYLGAVLHTVHTAKANLVPIRISANSRRISSTMTGLWLFTELVRPF